MSISPDKSKFGKSKKQGRLTGICPKNQKARTTVAHYMYSDEISERDKRNLYNAKRQKRK